MLMYKLNQWLAARIARRSCRTLEEFTRTGSGTLRVLAPASTSSRDVHRFIRAVERQAGPVIADIGFGVEGYEITLRRAA